MKNTPFLRVAFLRSLLPSLYQSSTSRARAISALVVLLGMATLLAGAAQTTTTTLALTTGGSSNTQVSPGTVVTLTATVAAGSTPVTAGLVNFCDASAAHCSDIHVLGTAQLTKAGTAVFKFRPGIGSHSFNAVFGGTASDTTSTSNTTALTVSGLYPTATSLSSSGSAGAYTLTATVDGRDTTAPTGVVSFLDASHGNTVLGTGTLGPGTPGIEFFDSFALPAGGDAYAVAVGDFNGDGIPDVAWTSNAAAGYALNILLGNGDGTFTAAFASPTTGVQPTSIAVGDFNGDGIPDLAVANYGSNTITVLLGKGDGTFTSVSTSPATGTNPSSIAVGDFNRDGIADLAVSNNGSDTVTVLLGNGDGTFTATSTSPATGDNPNSIAVGDFNGDGIPDLAVGNRAGGPAYAGWPSGTISILLGNGDGTFMAETAIPATEDVPSSLVVADFNGDGIPDVAAGGVGGYDGFILLLGNGDGTFTVTNPDTNSLGPIAVGDFNGDGLPDVAETGFFYHGSQPPLEIALTETQTSTVTVTIAGPVALGTQQVVASYPGDSNYSASTSNSIALASSTGTPTVTVSGAPQPAALGASVTVTATVTGPGLTPTGTVTFFDESGQFGTGTLNSSGVATYTTTAFPAGSHSITASYSGDTNYTAATSPAFVETITAATPAVKVTPSSSSITTLQPLTVAVAVSGGSGTPTPTGSVTLTSGSYTSAATTLSSGSASISIAAGTLATGTNTLTAAYTPDAASSTNYTSASGSGSVVVTVPSNAVPGINSLSPAFVSSGSAAFTLTVTGTGFVSGTTAYWGTAAVTTQVTSSTQLTAQITAAEVASAGITALTVQSPAPGGGASNALQFEVDSGGTGTGPTFSPSTATVSAGATASYPVTLPASATNVSVSCLNLPSGATCAYSSTSGNVTIATSSTTPKGTFQITAVFTETLPGAAAGFIFLPFLLLPLLAMRRKLMRGNAWITASLMLLLLAGAAAVVGCGGGGSNSTPPPPQTHQVTSSAALTLTVQ